MAISRQEGHLSAQLAFNRVHGGSLARQLGGCGWESRQREAFNLKDAVMLSALLEPQEPRLGVMSCLSLGQYLSGPGLSYSGLKAFARSPRHYWNACMDPNRGPALEKTGQLEGTLAHCAILEPSAFAARYVVGPEVNHNSHAWRDFIAEHTAYQVISAAQQDAAFAQARSVRAHRDIAKLLALGEPEVSAFWLEPATGVMCRCRPDWVHPVGDRGAILLDVKTYQDARPSEFARQIARKRYHWQAAFYTDGFSIASARPVLGFVFVAVESAPPYACSAVMLSESALETARREMAPLTQSYAQCLERNEWPGYSDGICEVDLPRWYDKGVSDE